MSFSAGPSHVAIRWDQHCVNHTVCDDHEEDGNDEFWIQVYQGGKSDLPSSHRVNLVPRPVILSKVLLTLNHCQNFSSPILIVKSSPHTSSLSIWIILAVILIQGNCSSIHHTPSSFIISELRILMVPRWFTIRYHLNPIQGIWKQSATAEWKNPFGPKMG